MCVRLLQSCLTLCNPMDCSPPISVQGIFQQEYWSGSPSPIPGDLPGTGMEHTSVSPELAGGLVVFVCLFVCFLPLAPPWKPFCATKKEKICLISGTNIYAGFSFPQSLLPVFQSALSICGAKDWNLTSGTQS